MSHPRRTDIDMAKGMAILLVVFGHIVARTDPAGVTWYEPLRRAVYAFHMPFFLYLSGLAAAVSGALWLPPAALPGLLKSRAERLLLPFLGLGLLIVIGKFFAGKVMFVDNAPGGLGAGLMALLWHTAASPASSIWYLFVLFTVSLAIPAALQGRPERLKVIMALSLALYPLQLPAFVYLDRIGQYAVFFMAGAWAGACGESWTELVDRSWPFCLALLFGALLVIALFGANWPVKLALLPIGMLSMPALHGLVRYLPVMISPVFLFLGRYCFVIYLFNTVFIGLAKGILLHCFAWRASDFGLLSVALMASGTLGPVALKHYAFRHISRLDRLTN